MERCSDGANSAAPSTLSRTTMALEETAVHDWCCGMSGDGRTRCRRSATQLRRLLRHGSSLIHRSRQC